MKLYDYLDFYKCGKEFNEVDKILKKLRSRNSPWSVEFYTSRGMTLLAAKGEIEIKRKNRKRQATSPAQPEHWASKGMTLSDAEARAAEYRVSIGSLPTLAKLIVKFGEESGQEKWKVYTKKVKNRQHTFLVGASESITEAKLIRWFNTSKTKNGPVVKEYNYSDFEKYCKAVKTATKIAVAVYGNEIDPERNKLGLIYGKNGYHLDHKFSKYGGFVNNIHPLLLGCKDNLRLVSKKENLSKGQFCIISIDELISYKTIIEDITLSEQIRNTVSEIFINK